MPSLERMTPADEEHYERIIKTASRLDTELHYEFIDHLATLIVEDGPSLDPDLVRSAVALVTGSGRDIADHLVFALAHRLPWLLDDAEFLRRIFDTAAGGDPLAFLLYRTLARNADLGEGELDVAQISLTLNPLFSSDAVPEMVGEFARLPVENRTACDLLDLLMGFGDLAWLRVAPGDLMRLITNRPSPLEWSEIGGAVESYLACHRAAGTPESELAGLRSLASRLRR